MTLEAASLPTGGFRADDPQAQGEAPVEVIPADEQAQPGAGRGGMLILLGLAGLAIWLLASGSKRPRREPTRDELPDDFRDALGDDDEVLEISEVPGG